MHFARPFCMRRNVKCNLACEKMRNIIFAGAEIWNVNLHAKKCGTVICMTETAERCFVCAEKRNVIFACEKMRNAVLQSLSDNKIILIAPKGSALPPEGAFFYVLFCFGGRRAYRRFSANIHIALRRDRPALCSGTGMRFWGMAAAYALDEVKRGGSLPRFGYERTSLCPVHFCAGSTAASPLAMCGGGELSLCGQVSEKDMSVRAGVGMPAGSADLCTGKLQNTGGTVSTKSAFFIPKCTNFSRFSAL